MILITEQIRARLLENGAANKTRMVEDGETIDFHPVVKLFTPDASATWLLSEVDPEQPDIAFGLCDLGMGCPELGSVSLADIHSVKGPAGLPVERDMHFTATMTLTEYAEMARIAGAILT